MKYVDKKGRQIEVGQIIKYDEGEGYAKSIDLIVELDDVLCMDPETLYDNGRATKTFMSQGPVDCQFAQLNPNSKDGILIDCEIIGTIKENPEMLTVEFCDQLFA